MAVTRKIALSAMEEGNVQEVDTYAPISINPEPMKVAEQMYVVFRLVNNKIKRLTLDGIQHDVLNPKTGEYETMRLLRGAKSIWTSDLTELLKDKEYVSKNRIGVQFLDSICRVGIHEKTKLEFLRNHPHNVKEQRNGAGKYDFYEYDAAAEQQRKHDAAMDRINTITYVNNLEEQKMIKLALFLGIKPYDDEVGLPRTPQGYRTELLLKADRQPEIVKRYLNSPEVEISYLVRKAILDAKIDLTGQSGNAIWAGGGGFICKIPSGKKAIEYLTELAMSNSNEGRQFKEQLQQMT